MSAFDAGRKRAFKRLRTLGGKKLPKPKLEFVSPVQVDTTPDELDALIRLVGDVRLAKRIMALRVRYPNGTTPELAVFDWLQQQKWIEFEYQVNMYGGRRAPSGVGMVPDFVVWTDASNAMVWQVQGEYWHTVGNKEEQDRANNLRMLGQVINGARIGAVVELWEDDIYRKRGALFAAALAGVGLRG